MAADPDHDRLFLLQSLGKWAACEAEARRVIAARPDWHMGYGHLAHALLFTGRKAEAVDAARAGVKRAAEEVWAWAVLTMTLNGVMRYPEAVTAGRTAVRLGPHYAAAHYQLAEALYWTDVGAALAAATAGLARHPDCLRLVLYRAWSERKLGRPAACAATVAAGLARHPQSDGLHHLRAVLFWEAAGRGGGRVLRRAAETAVREVLRLSPADA